MMRSRIPLCFAVCLTLAACTTVPTAPDAPPPGTQALLVRTDPPGASCSILQDGAVVASVAVTPGTAHVPRSFQGFVFTPQPEELPPIEVLCRKEGYLESRKTFAVQWAAVVASEETPPREPSAADIAGGAASVVAAVAVSPGSGLAMVAVAAPMVGIPILAVAAIVGATREKPPPFAYRALPEFLLTPTGFASATECDAHFASLATKFEAARDAKRAYIDAQCRFWPCKASDSAPCPDLVCDRRRAMADDQLKVQLEEIPALRAKVRIATP